MAGRCGYKPLKFMKQTLENLLNTTTDRRVIQALKKAAIIAQQYELASELRTIETTKFPLTDEEKSAHKTAHQFNIGLRMLNFNISPKNTWSLYQLAVLYSKKKGRMTMDCVEKIRDEATVLFRDED